MDDLDRRSDFSQWTSTVQSMPHLNNSGHEGWEAYSPVCNTWLADHFSAAGVLPGDARLPSSSKDSQKREELKNEK